MGIVEETLENIRLTRKKYTKIASKLEKRLEQLEKENMSEAEKKKRVAPVAKRLDWVDTGLERLDEQEQRIAKRLEKE